MQPTQVPKLEFIRILVTKENGEAVAEKVKMI
jgi:hypothetical protein